MAIGRALALSLLVAFALGSGACREDNQGAPRVVVIGGDPRIVDPAQDSLSGPDSVLLANVAQGLVRFDANGNIVGGIAERWAVTDDSLSYIFRLGDMYWSNGRKVTAQQVARSLKRSILSNANPLKDPLGAVDDVVAMTDRVIEIRLSAPRPNLLALLAQPELAVIRNAMGTGPFRIDGQPDRTGVLRLSREVVSDDQETTRRDRLTLAGRNVAQAIGDFERGSVDLVLGGTFNDLPLVRTAKLPRNSLQFDPASGLFGLVPVRSNGVVGDVAVRRLLSQAIDRTALIDALRVPGLTPRVTILEPGLEGVPDPAVPPWTASPLADRRPALAGESARLFGDDAPVVRIFIPTGRGGDLLFERLAADWSAIGLGVERAANPASADLKLVDAVAPSASPAWFLRQFRCGVVPICDPDADAFLESARDTLIPAQRAAFLGLAATQIDDSQLFIPLAAPVRWSLVSGRIQGFAGNRYARHTLVDLEQKLNPGGP
ncbi:MAG TPA: ABC transporter substrate-binding protein [Sphingomicrobium sp.]|nr:ABC transporter substrate-binding protein [Sphingomicrobium sp.]